MNSHDVIIIGAGPTGLMAAVQLARYDINFLITDTKSGPTEQSRAIAVTARSMEIYQQLGISDTATEQGQFMEDFALFINGKEKMTIHIGELGKGLTDFPYLLAFEQSKNEKLLAETLIKFDRKVNWNTEFKNLKLYDDYVELSLSDRSVNPHSEYIVRAKYLIACDGAKSLVRHLLNLKFEGSTYENKFFVADTQMVWGQLPNKLIISPSKKNFVGFFPLHGTSSHRILGSLPKEYHDNENITFSDVEQMIVKTMKFPLEIKKVNWFSIYNLHHRCVESFRYRNCFLAGDSAHIHSPAGGQGMNTGLQDAYNLAWKLSFVIKGIANEKLLETYNSERLPFAHWLLKFTDRMFGIMTSDNPFIAFFRQYIIPSLIKIVFKSRQIRPMMFKTASQIKWSYNKSPISKNLSGQKLSFNAGDRLPYVLINKSSVYKLLTEPKFHLLVIGIKDLEKELKNYLLSREDFIKVINLGIAEEKEFGVTKPLFILVRPDNYIGLIADELNETLLSEYLITSLHFKN